MVMLRPDPKKCDPRFLLYSIQSRAVQEEIKVNEGTGSTVSNLRIPLLEALPIAHPPLPEQKAIAAVLGALDDKIELNRRMNATLEAMARALYQSWFVDFDPVRAKLDGRPPTGLDPETAAIFPATFQDSPLGHIPQGWRVGSIYEIANVIYGAPFASSLFNSEKLGKPLIRIRDLPNESPAVFTTEVHLKGYLLQPGDIAVGMDGEFRAYLWAGVESWLNQRVCVFAPKPGYSAAFVRNSIFAPLAQVEATETATTVIHIGKNDIDRFTVIIPDARVAEAFKRQCQPWYDQIVANKQQSRTLATLRDILLPVLMSGKISVPNGQLPEGELV
jgi:type I restriction enzyme S subunit